ncbi:MAG: ribosome biogenesis GTPase Der [SAR202 cluster bacterium]|nr:ribosome biogenesis GTPase Der [SAR202 cluster bacterium]MQG68571.1 ribosome biogenesis GTPase Der [SAR202 cluster bacterium]HAL48660.1 ribosome biogenesis GTPase Der [Dehalococcoidia bacterium]
MNKPVVAIVGRPNVGKSTMFNRLVGRSVAIVSKMAGTTRDRVTTETEWGDHLFILVDTGGLEVFPETELWRQVRDQIETAIADADVIVMVVDVTQGVTPDDIDVAALLRPSGRKIVLAANKSDTEARGAGAAEFYELGLGEPYPISAYHNIGLDDVMAEVIANFPDESAFPEQEADLRLAIVGRPNVGKSMMLNKITGQQRSIVSDVPGTTRDTIDTLITHNDTSILLIDTAGIRRRGKIGTGVEKYSVVRAIRAIDRADVAVLLLDAAEIATAQDTHIASQILESFKGIVLAVNKWDLASELGATRDDATAVVRDRFKFASFAPIRFTSAMTGMGLVDLLDTTLSVYGQWTKGLPRYHLRRTVMNAIAEHPPVAHKGRSVKIYSVAQEQTGPPSFTFYVNKADTVHFSYQRYLENRLREAYDFRGSPLRMRFKSRGER